MTTNIIPESFVVGGVLLLCFVWFFTIFVAWDWGNRYGKQHVNEVTRQLSDSEKETMLYRMIATNQSKVITDVVEQLCVLKYIADYEHTMRIDQAKRAEECCYGRY